MPILPKFNQPESPSDPVRKSKGNPYHLSMYLSQRISKADRERVEYTKRVQLDWKTYFLQFCQYHGEPVQYKSVLLFRDGWRYGMEYSGPEYPPPADHHELDVLVTEYWLARLRLCNKVLSRLLVQKEELLAQVSNHSLPLHRVVIINHDGRNQKSTVPFDINPIDEQIRWYRTDVLECKLMLKEINSYGKTGKDTVGLK